MEVVESLTCPDMVVLRVVLLFKSLVSDKSPDMVAHLVDMVNGRDVGQAVAMLQLWQSLIRDCVSYSISGDEQAITNIDFSAEIMRLAGRIDPTTTGPAMSECIKNTLADLRRNVHIHGALVALALRLKACT